MPRAIPRTKLDGGALRETRVCLCYLFEVKVKLTERIVRYKQGQGNSDGGLTLNQMFEFGKVRKKNGKISRVQIRGATLRGKLK